MFVVYTLLVIVTLSTLSVAQSGARPGRNNTDAMKVASAWFAGWHAKSGFPVSNISWSKYTHMTYAFAETTPDVHTLSLEGSNPDILPEFVEQAHKHGVKALVSVGGWTGSRWWSSNVGSAKNRTDFVVTLTRFARRFQLDGLDFDWEYPGNQGIGCNVVSSDDTTNFLSFIEELRKDAVGATLILTAATATVPFLGPDGSPLSDISRFSKGLDYIAIMNYDICGPWSTSVGPNAPLNDTCTEQFPSATSAVGAWVAGGMPPNQIVLGVASYGHSFRVRQSDAFVAGSTSNLTSFPNFDANDQPVGDSWDDGAGVDECGVQQQPGGDVDFWGLIHLGFLDENGKPTTGIAYRFDDCSQTPYVYNSTTEVMVSFDDAKSFSLKGKFIKSRGIRGFAMWEAGGDFNDILLNAIRQTM